jgi:hypothetical protein
MLRHVRQDNSYVNRWNGTTFLTAVCTRQLRPKHIVIFFFFDRASRYKRAKKNRLDAQLILKIFRQPIHVSGVSVAHHQEVQPYVYNNWYLLSF